MGILGVSRCFVLFCFFSEDAHGDRKERDQIPVAVVTSGCEAPVVGAGNQTQSGPLQK